MTDSAILDLLADVGARVRGAVRPILGLRVDTDGKRHSASGDIEFRLDEVAEDAITDSLGSYPEIAVYTEGRGLVVRDSPKYLLVIDPVDGTRPARVGLEMCVVSIACCPWASAKTLGSVSHACLVEIKSARSVTAVRGGIVLVDGHVAPPPSHVHDLDRMAWSFELAGRPSLSVASLLAPIIDRSSLGGGVFVYASTAFSVLKVALGEMDAAVDIGGRVLRDLRPDRPFVGLQPYDIAAAKLIAEVAGCPFTDAWGRPLDDWPLLAAGPDPILSCLCASNPTLHGRLRHAIDAQFAAFGPP
ncbi:MAG TPA: inositol monophosphatase family protein [Fimbriimonadaceae bacterium]|nr:inositol monophosphatase family protein [Fimbriimonadaceae bacterium]